MGFVNIDRYQTNAVSFDDTFISCDVIVLI